jgi:hypothetical protein
MFGLVTYVYRFFVTGPICQHILVVFCHLLFLFLQVVWIVIILPYYFKYINGSVPVIGIILGLIA